LRRQAHMQGKEEARPLIVMSPKSLLRNERVASEPHEFTEGKFQPLRNQPNLEINYKAKRLLLGTGKIMVDIEEEIANSEANFDFLRAMRIEQLYPFPADALSEELEKISDVEEVVKAIKPTKEENDSEGN